MKDAITTGQDWLLVLDDGRRLLIRPRDVLADAMVAAEAAASQAYGLTS
jgi:hypothetical protein